MIVPDGSFDLEEGHNYIVRLTIKVPSDGQYMVNIGTWSNNSQLFSSVKARDDFQIIDVEYPEYKNSVSGCHVLLGCGWVVGTTILKEVEVLEKTSTAGVRSAKPAKDADDTIYNLSGQKVNASYKGIIIQNGKKAVKTAKATDGAIYNLAGQKVDSSYKGIVIKNGKKYINNFDK